MLNIYCLLYHADNMILIFLLKGCLNKSKHTFSCVLSLHQAISLLLPSLGESQKERIDIFIKQQNQNCFESNRY